VNQRRNLKIDRVLLFNKLNFTTIIIIYKIYKKKIACQKQWQWLRKDHIHLDYMEICMGFCMKRQTISGLRRMINGVT
jgi:hypothetical protein